MVQFFHHVPGNFCHVCLMILPAVLQPAFLKEVITIPKEQAGSINAGLQSMSLHCNLLFVGLVGILSDKVGRRILAISGFVACGVFLHHVRACSRYLPCPGNYQCEGQVFITYIMRFLVGMGLITCYPQFIALVADYTDKRDRRKGMALNGIMMRFGFYSCFSVAGPGCQKNGLMSLFYLAGAIGIFLELSFLDCGLWIGCPKTSQRNLA